jgi:hypothetical protein
LFLKLIEKNDLVGAEKEKIGTLMTGIILFGVMNQNSTYIILMDGREFGECQKKSMMLTVLFLLLNMAEEE